MGGPVDGMIWFQVAGVTLPTVSVVMLFVRLGSLLRTIQQLESDMKGMASTLKDVSSVVVELAAWRDAAKSNQVDVLERVRRLEDLEFKSRSGSR